MKQHSLIGTILLFCAVALFPQFSPAQEQAAPANNFPPDGYEIFTGIFPNATVVALTVASNQDGVQTFSADAFQGDQLLKVRFQSNGTILEQHTFDQISIEQLPADIRRTVDEQLNGGELERLMKTMQDGKAMYLATVVKGSTQPASKFDMTIDETGSVTALQVIQ